MKRNYSTNNFHHEAFKESLREWEKSKNKLILGLKVFSIVIFIASFLGEGISYAGILIAGAVFFYSRKLSKNPYKSAHEIISYSDSGERILGNAEIIYKKISPENKEVPILVFTPEDKSHPKSSGVVVNSPFLEKKTLAFQQVIGSQSIHGQVWSIDTGSELLFVGRHIKIKD